MAKRIKEIIEKNNGGKVDPVILYSRKQYNRHCYDIEIVAWWEVREFCQDWCKENVDLGDMWADSYESMSLDEFETLVDGDFNGLCDPDAEILVIWMTKKSHDYLYDPEVKTVREIRLANWEKYSDYIVVCRNRYSEDYEDEYPAGYECYDEDYNPYEPGPEKMSLVEGKKSVLDEMYAKDWYLVDEKAFRAGFDVSGSKELTWWNDESFRQHFGFTKAVLLVIVLI